MAEFLAAGNHTTMLKLSIPAIIFATTLLGLTVPAKADIPSTIGEFDESPFLVTPATLGVFTFTIPTGETVVGGTISGTFGNNDVPGFTNVTALSDYFVANGAIKVAGCDSFTDPCIAGTVSGAPDPWSYTFSQNDLTTLAPYFSAGSLDFSVTQNSFGAIQTGPITLDLQVTPEPSSYAFTCALCLAGIVVLRRRFRKA
jgi:hypothetical protein